MQTDRYCQKTQPQSMPSNGCVETFVDYDGHAHHQHEEGDAQTSHQHNSNSRRAMFVALLLTAGFAIVELLGGVWSGSLALISDAGHMATDAASLFLAWLALWFMRRPVSRRLSFGYMRAEVLAAFVNALAMGVLIGVICWEAVQRIVAPEPVRGQAVIWIAAIGLCVNLIVLWLLHGGHDKHADREGQAHELNRRAAVLHVVGDLLGSLAALIAGWVVLSTGWTLIDPLLSLFVCVLLARSTWVLLRDATLVLMEAVPSDLDYHRVGDCLQTIPGILSVHDLHIWSMAPGQPALSAHVKVSALSDWAKTLEAARNRLRTEFKIDHITLQPEQNS